MASLSEEKGNSTSMAGIARILCSPGPSCGNMDFGASHALVPVIEALKLGGRQGLGTDLHRKIQTESVRTPGER